MTGFVEDSDIGCFAAENDFNLEAINCINFASFAINTGFRGTFKVAIDTAIANFEKSINQTRY